MPRSRSTPARPLLLFLLALVTLAFAGIARAEESAAPTPLLLDVILNGETQDVAPLLQAEDGRLYASASTLAGWRLRAAEAARMNLDGETYYALAALPGVRVSEAPGEQRVDIVAPPEAFERTSVSFGRPGGSAPRVERGGVYVNYDFLFERAGEETRLAGSAEAVVFTEKGVGTTTAVARLDGRAGLTRLESSWTFDDPKRMRSLRIGDSFTRGGIGATPLRFGGIQLARNFAVQPNFLTLPLPSLDGTAAAPSVIDIFVNNSLAAQREVAPGPFALDRLPVVSGAGDVRLVVRDALGRETTITRSYYAASQLLRAGLSDYSYEIGFLRENFGSESNDYGALAASATHRHGVTDWLTGEVHAEATASTQQAGIGADLLAPGLGLFNLSLAASRNDFGSGALVGLGFERQTAGGLSGGIRAEATAGDYADIARAEANRSPATLVQAYLGLPTAFGSFGASYLWRDEQGEDRAQILSASASLDLGRFGNLHLSAQQTITGKKKTLIGIFLTKSLGPRLTGSAAYEGGDDYRRGSAAIHQALPVGEGFGYRASLAQGRGTQLDGWAGYQGASGFYEAEVSRSGGANGVRLGTSGSIGVLGGSVFAARRLEDGFAQVRVDGVKGVHVYANNQLIGTTNRDGVLLVPRLQAWEANTLRIDPEDVPLDYVLTHSQVEVTPYARSGLVVRFAAERPSGGMIRLVRADGSPIPSGAKLRAVDGDENFIVAPGGEAYVTGLRARNRMEASWAGESCIVSFAYRPGETQAALGTHVCEPVLPIRLALLD